MKQAFYGISVLIFLFFIIYTSHKGYVCVVKEIFTDHKMIDLLNIFSPIFGGIVGSFSVAGILAISSKENKNSSSKTHQNNMGDY